MKAARGAAAAEMHSSHAGDPKEAIQVSETPPNSSSYPPALLQLPMEMWQDLVALPAGMGVVYMVLAKRIHDGLSGVG